MAATKKTTPKKAKKPTAKVAVPAARPPRKQSSGVGTTKVGQEMFTLVLASLFTVLSVFFAIISYWRYHG